MNTLEQTCERKDGVSCDGGPAVPLGQEKHVKLQSAEDEATKSARAKKRRRQDDTLDSAIREYVGLVLSVVCIPSLQYIYGKSVLFRYVAMIDHYNNRFYEPN